MQWHYAARGSIKGQYGRGGAGSLARAAQQRQGAGCNTIHTEWNAFNRSQQRMILRFLLSRTVYRWFSDQGHIREAMLFQELGRDPLLLCENTQITTTGK